MGAHVEAPPCILQRPLVIAGDWQDVPDLVLARQRELVSIANLFCMGLFLNLDRVPTPRLTGSGSDHAHYSLPTRVDVHVLYSDLMLALTPMTVQSFQQRCVCPGKLIGLRQVFSPALEGLLTNHRSSIALHSRIVGGDQLRCHHALAVQLHADR